MFEFLFQINIIIVHLLLNLAGIQNDSGKPNKPQALRTINV